jgi:flagellar biosynthesis chaperone FliJ
MAQIVYPLAQVILVKENRVKEQEKVVAEKRRALEKEREKLQEAEQARDKVKQHYNDKLTQMRYKLDTGTNTDEIQQMRVYLKVVQEKLVVEEKKVEEQLKQVQQAEKNLEIALEQLKRRRQEVDKFIEHRKGWLKEAQREQELAEINEQDEMGSIIFVGKNYRRN